MRISSIASLESKETRLLEDLYVKYIKIVVQSISAYSHSQLQFNVWHRYPLLKIFFDKYYLKKEVADFVQE